MGRASPFRWPLWQQVGSVSDLILKYLLCLEEFPAVQPALL